MRGKNKLIKQIVNEDSTAAASLHSKSMSGDDIEINKAIEHLSKLNAAQKARYLDMVQKMFRDSAWRRPGAGAPDASAKNQRFNKNEELDWKTVAEHLVRQDLEAELEEIGFTKDSQDKVADLFFEAVERRGDDFQARLFELLADCIPSPLISDEELDVCEILANRIEDLENALQYVESENDQLAEEIRAEADDFKADLQQHEALTFRSPKKSTLEEWMLEADGSNREYLFNEDREAHVGDPYMRSYLNACRGNKE